MSEYINESFLNSSLDDDSLITFINCTITRSFDNCSYIMINSESTFFNYSFNNGIIKNLITERLRAEYSFNNANINKCSIYSGTIKNSFNNSVIEKLEIDKCMIVENSFKDTKINNLYVYKDKALCEDLIKKFNYTNLFVKKGNNWIKSD